MVGVNNRDLTSFEVDYQRSIELSHQLPERSVKIAESGLSEVDTCVMLHSAGFNGFLIGEQFMKQGHPGDACTSFVSSFVNQKSKIS